MDNLRKLPLIVALVLSVIIVLLEIGSLALPQAAAAQAAGFSSLLPEGEAREAFEELAADEQAELLAQDRPPGLAVPALAFLDGIVLFTVALVGTALLLPETVQAKTQGVVTLIFSILLILAAVVAIMAALAAVILMVALLLAIPFGTLIYLAKFGFFNRAGANVALSLLMTLKIVFAVCLVLAQQRFLQNKGLVLLVLTSLLGNVIIGFLHGFVTGFLVSITDGIAAIVVAILAVLWAIFLLIGAVVSVFKAVT